MCSPLPAGRELRLLNSNHKGLNQARMLYQILRPKAMFYLLLRDVERGVNAHQQLLYLRLNG